jgi:hypothetical protein
LPKIPVAASDSRLTLVLPGLLTDTPAAKELAKHLAAHTQVATLLGWLQAAAAPREQSFDVLEAGCTAREAWWLQRAGFQAGQNKIGAGLAPLFTSDESSADTPEEPVWLAELAHIQVGRDGLALTDPAQLELDASESAALLEAAQPALLDTGFRADALGVSRWRIHAHPGTVQHMGTPDAVAGHPLDSWWPRGDAVRPWRRLVNEVQMLWHEHPVNTQREARGVPRVNGLWLHGGAAPWRPWPNSAPRRLAGGTEWQRALAERAGVPWCDAGAPAPQTLAGMIAELPDLIDPERMQDWHAWLAALPRLERDWFVPAAQALQTGAVSGIELVLPAQTRVVTLQMERRAPLLRWLPQLKHPKHDWKHWWLPRES